MTDAEPVNAHQGTGVGPETHVTAAPATAAAAVDVPLHLLSLTNEYMNNNVQRETEREDGLTRLRRLGVPSACQTAPKTFPAREKKASRLKWKNSPLVCFFFLIEEM